MSIDKPILLKICGMRDRQNILDVAALGPQYMGFIFYEKSPRYVGNDFVLPQGLPASLKKVGVFVDATTQKMIETARRLSLDYLQLHGAESPEQVRDLKREGFGVMKVFSIGSEFDFSVLDPYEQFVDYFLFDTKGKYYGGNAQRFDWSILREYKQNIPFLLSGGLSPENAGEIGTLSDMNLHALDVNSGVETHPGFKDLDRIKMIKEIIQRN